MKRKSPLPLRDAWFIWFFLGVVMLNYPFLHIINKNVQIFGFPLTFLYFYIGWPVSIFVVYLFSVYLGHQRDQQNTLEDQAKMSTEQK